MEVFGLVEFKDIYASELEDVRTCENCKAIDGHKYASIEDAQMDYVFGGYKDCAGGFKCRGTPVVICKTESTPSVQ